MRRREIVTLLGGTAFAWPRVLHAQRTPSNVIGFLGSASPAAYAPFVDGFHRGLNAAGFVEGRNVEIIYRWAEGQYDRLPALAADLVARRVSLIVATGGLPSSQAAVAATTTIPIVFTLGSDPVRFGLVASMSRPGANVTGVTLFAYLLEEKRVELAHELVPGARTIAILLNPSSAQATSESDDVRAAARANGLQLLVLNASSDRDFDAAFATLVQQGAGALLVSPDAFMLSRRNQLVALAARHAVPVIYEWRQFAEAGGLISYGINLVDAYRQAGDYAGRILRGANPADLPVLQPTTFELVINLSAARALGLTIPQSILLRADELIE